MTRGWSKPTEVGDYWRRTVGTKSSDAWLDYVREDTQGILVDSEGWHVSDGRDEWLGPIKPGAMFSADDVCVLEHLLESMTRTARVQHDADAEVGRMLREIGERQSEVGLQMHLGVVQGVFSCSPRAEPWSFNRDWEATGPDALERAHDKLCGGSDDDS